MLVRGARSASGPNLEAIAYTNGFVNVTPPCGIHQNTFAIFMPTCFRLIPVALALSIPSLPVSLIVGATTPDRCWSHARSPDQVEPFGNQEAFISEKLVGISLLLCATKGWMLIFLFINVTPPCGFARRTHLLYASKITASEFSPYIISTFKCMLWESASIGFASHHLGRHNSYHL